MSAHDALVNRVVIVGNIGGGKTTLARHLAGVLNLPLHELDKVFFPPGYKEVPTAEFVGRFQQILASDRWVVEGLEKADVLDMAIVAADMVVMIDLPLPVHYWRTVKRRVLAIWHGHPDELPVKRGWRAVLGQYRMLWFVHRRLVPHLRDSLGRIGDAATVYHLKSGKEQNSFTRRFD